MAQGNKMSNRSWFFASSGQQQGPYPEDQFRDLIARGTVRADTLVWTEGMSGWQRAGDIPGLIPGGRRRRHPFRSRVDRRRRAGGHTGATVRCRSSFRIWAFLGRSLLFVIGLLLVIPRRGPATSFYRWLVARHSACRGGRTLPSPASAGDIWYVFVAIGALDLCRGHPRPLSAISLHSRFRASCRGC